MVQREGIGISPGAVIAEAAVLRHSGTGVEHTVADDSGNELSVFSAAYDSALSSLDTSLASSDDEKAMLMMLQTMLSDPDYLNQIDENIRERKYNAAWAVEAATEKYASMLDKLGDGYFSERASDIRDAGYILIDAIRGEALSAFHLTKPSILVADYLLPSEFLRLDRSYLKGLCLDGGGKTSHIAILSRSADIPAVFALGDFSIHASNGSVIAMDGKYGTAVIDPQRRILSEYRLRCDAAAKADAELQKEAGLPAETTDGFRIRLMCNIEGLDGVDGAISSGAEGIGLFRTEFLALQKAYLEDEGKMDHVYQEAVERMSGYGPVTFRTYDIGGDKVLDGMGINEENPILGWRAVRFCMENKELFRSQLVSILKASAVCRSVRIMFPMISGSEELCEVLSFLEEVKSECRAKGIPFDENMEIGTMIEVPSAAITADVLADHVDFMSIGTNDLIQYTIAVDRGNEKISYLYQPLHPAVLRLIKYVVDSAKKKGKKVSMCGEMAGEAEYLPILVGMGFDELSMSAHSILEAKRRIRLLDKGSCTQFVNHVLSLPDAVSIEAALKEFSEQYGKA